MRVFNGSSLGTHAVNCHGCVASASACRANPASACRAVPVFLLANGLARGRAWAAVLAFEGVPAIFLVAARPGVAPTRYMLVAARSGVAPTRYMLALIKCNI